MSQTLINNAYHILGLDTSSTQKDVSKRAKEIINRLKIDDKPLYDTDIEVSDDLRSEALVKDAAEKLQLPKKKIKEYFLWFQVSDEVDEDAIKHLKKNEEVQAIETWKNASEPNTAKALFYKKNLALLYCLLLVKTADKQYLQDSLKGWSENEPPRSKLRGI